MQQEPGRTRRASVIASTVMIHGMLAMTAWASPQDDALIAAARKGNPDAVRAAIEGGADVDAKTEYGATALSFAAEKGNIAVARLLVLHGADDGSGLTSALLRRRFGAARVRDHSRNLGGANLPSRPTKSIARTVEGIPTR